MEMLYQDRRSAANVVGFAIEAEADAWLVQETRPLGSHRPFHNAGFAGLPPRAFADLLVSGGIGSKTTCEGRVSEFDESVHG